MAARVGEPAADVGVLGAHGDAQAPPLRLHHPHPVADAAPAHRRPPADRRDRPAAARRRRDRAAACGCSGSGVSGLSVYAQGDLFAEDDERAGARRRPPPTRRPAAAPEAELPVERRWWPGQDVRPRGARRRLGVGPRAGPGHRPLRGPADRARAGAHAGGRRPAAAARRSARLEDAPVTEPSMWTRLTEENPEHSAAYIQRFKDLAAAGHDLVGEARLVDAMLPRGLAGAGRGLRHRAGSPPTWPRSGTTSSAWTATRCWSPRRRRSTPGRGSWSATWPSSTCPPAGIAEPFDAIVCAGNVVTFLAPSTRAGGAAPAAGAPARPAAAPRSASAPAAATTSTTSSPTPRAAGLGAGPAAGHLGPAAVHARTPTSWSPCCVRPDPGRAARR